MTREYLFLASEITELEQLLSEVPDANAIERMGLEYRLESIRNELDSMSTLVSEVNMSRASYRPIAEATAFGAIANIGVQEEGENRGTYIELYQSSCVPPIPPGSPWCAAFVRYRMKAAANKLNMVYDATFPRSGYTPDWSRWAKANNKWVSAADLKSGEAYTRLLPGDLALFYFPTLGRIAHIGIITKVSKRGLTTVEGNTSPEPQDADEVERDGDGVFMKDRRWSELGEYGGVLLVDF
jgi:hypothetical protein